MYEPRGKMHLIIGDKSVIYQIYRLVNGAYLHVRVGEGAS